MSVPVANGLVRQILSREGVALPLLTRGDLAGISVDPGDVIAAGNWSGCCG